jgi:hypothetical protein
MVTVSIELHPRNEMNRELRQEDLEFRKGMKMTQGGDTLLTLMQERQRDQ